MADGRPSDFMFVLAFAMFGDERLCADEICGLLRGLGFPLSTQQVAAALSRIAKKDLPPIEKTGRLFYDGPWTYRLTHWGENEIRNGLPGARLRLPYRNEDEIARRVGTSKERSHG